MEVTERLIEADAVEMEALAHPQTKPTLNEMTGKVKHNGLAGWASD